MKQKDRWKRRARWLGWRCYEWGLAIGAVTLGGGWANLFVGTSAFSGVIALLALLLALGGRLQPGEEHLRSMPPVVEFAARYGLAGLAAWHEFWFCAVCWLMVWCASEVFSRFAERKGAA